MTMRIDILMCTFRRPMVGEAIEAIGRVNLPPDVDLRLVIADNDDTDSARAVVAHAAGSLPFPCHYIHAPARNISLARNACLDAASARQVDWIVSLDDDETVAPDWLTELMDAVIHAGADGGFGTVQALYPEDAPAWVSALDLHSSHPETFGTGWLRTGNSGNVALRWHGTGWSDQRYDLSRGVTGGEDTEFFLRLSGMGVRLIAAPRAVVTEPVPATRQTLEWLAVRRYRMGQTHVVTAQTGPQRAWLFVTAAAKFGYCRVMQVLRAGNETRRNFWLLRGQLHKGVCAGLLDRPAPQLYGRDPV
ncbi:glycosyltransferase [Paracoccus lutimaris]|uniref:Succinoglycan biosynthesis protein ExoM n=1 Tax=Paracoccus lutimaris TaxID=1490030 RepID=A0A368YNB5_9RHOB|nr:glycosyltransferase [Paracoccus lutimaris]RCW79644.1 succinoglycan biosynthesis protein ExoM [Paracoccus lutimaris]